MKTLNKEQKQQHVSHVQALKLKRAAVDEAVSVYNEALRTMKEAVDYYNEEVEEAQEFVSNVVGEIADFRSEKTEKWEETNGDRYNEWESELDAAASSLELIEVEAEEIEIEDEDHDFINAFPFAVGDKE